MEKKAGRQGRFTIAVLLMLLGASLVVAPGTAVADQDGDYIYTVSDGKATITGYTGTDGNIAIPSTIGGYPVIAIGYGAFYKDTDLTSVIIGHNVTSIGDGSFISCTSLTSISFLGLVAPSSVGYDWISWTNPGIKGHAYAASNFPAPGGIWNGLTMGASIDGGSDGSPTSDDRAVPPVPEPLFPYNGASYVPTTPALVCKQVTDPYGDEVIYEFCLDDNSNFSSPLFTASPSFTNDTSLAIGTDWIGALSHNVTYYWRVRAKDMEGISGWSSSWSFRVDGATHSIWDVVAGVSDSTVQKYWNYIDLVWKSFGHANSVFAENGIKVWLSVSKIYLFHRDGWSEASALQRHGRGLYVLFDEGGNFGGYMGDGWYVIGHNFLYHGQGIASDMGMDALMHELGHYRGVPDLYLYDVQPADNGVVPGMGHKYTDKNPPDLMYYPYGVHMMQDYTRCLINQTGNETRTQTVFDIWHGEFGPEYNYIIVRDKVGNPITGASVKIYTNRPYKNLNGGFAFGSSFDADAERSGTTGADGAFLFAQKYGKATDLGFDLCFISVSFDGTTEYAFLESVETGGLYWGYKKAPLLLERSVFDVFYSCAVPPGQPRNLRAEPGNGFAVLKWDPPASDGHSPINTYQIYRGTISGVEKPFITLGNVASFNDTGLAPLQTYYYRVSAVNAIGEGPKTTVVSTGSTTSRPGVPRELRATAGDGLVTLTWEAPLSDGGSPVIGYNLYANTTSGHEELFLNLGNLLAWTSSGGGTVGQRYYYQVTAVNSVGEGPRSDEVSVVLIGGATAPSAPRNLTASSANGYVTLTWSVPSSNGGSTITGYNLYANTTSGHAELFLNLGNVLTWTSSGGTIGQTYYYQVTAVNSVGEGPRSDELSIKLIGGATVPTAPLNLVAQGTLGQISLTWQIPESDGGSAIIGYKIFRATTSGSQGAVPLGTTSAIMLTYTDANIMANTYYYYTVKAVNAVGESAASNEESSISVTEKAPSAPTNLIAQAYDGYVILTWDASTDPGSSGIIGYDVYRGMSSDAVNTKIGNTSEGTLSYNDSTVSNGITYFYMVRAVNGVGSSASSNKVQVTPSAPSAPSAPRNLLTTGHDGYVLLTWEAPISNGTSAITGYDVYRSTVSGSAGPIVGNVTVGTLSYNDSSVINGVLYYYTITAINAIGPSIPSNEASAMPSQEGTAPGAPTDLNATAQEGSILLTWSAPSDAGSGVQWYLIYRSETSGGQSMTPLALVSGGTLTYTDSSVIVNMTYFYIVRANNSYGTSAASNEDSAAATEVMIRPPPVSRNLVAVAAEGKVTLTWDVPDGNCTGNCTYSLTAYHLYRRTSAGSPSLIASVNETVYIDTNVTNGQTYYYKVCAVNSAGEGSPTAEISATPNASSTDGATGRDDNTLLYAGAGVFGVAVVGAAAYLLLRRKK